MRTRFSQYACWVVVWLMLCMCGGIAANAQKKAGSSPVYYNLKYRFSTKSGIALLPYAPRTHIMVVQQGGRVMYQGSINNSQVFQLHLPNGFYELRSDDDYKLITVDLNAYNAPTGEQYRARLKSLVAKTSAKHIDGVQRAKPQFKKVASRVPRAATFSTGDGLTIIPVPRVSTSHYAEEPPSITADRHVVFTGVHTRLKAVILSGVSPYHVVWDPGDGTGTITLDTSDGYNGAAVDYTYTGNVGDLHDATITVTDQNNQTATEHYYTVIGNPGSQGDRIARSSDEALWYLHTQLQRMDGVSTYNPDTTTYEPPTDQAYIASGADSYLIAASAMFAICLENTGHSITGGLNFSNDPSRDAYVDDLNRLINHLTDYGTLQPINLNNVGNQTYWEWSADTYVTDAGNQKTYTGIGTVTFDTHGPGGVPNNIILVPNGHSVYDCGMHLQAIAQAGFVDAAVPNRSEYASYYDVIGDYVDGIQQAQGYDGTPEGGWRYSIGDLTYNDSDGSTAAWACIGLEAATRANTLTPNAPLAPITIAPFCIQALHDYWIVTDQVSDPTQTTTNNDYRTNSGGSPLAYTEHLLGGFGYSYALYGTNQGKTGGGIVSLKLAGLADNDPQILAAQGFLYRNFFAPDVVFGWNSARDSYGMYNILKGLTASNVVGTNSLLTDHTNDGTSSAGTDLDGFPLAPFDWYNTLVTFIAGADASDLGHQAWAENSTLSQGDDGHYAPNGTRGPVAPFVFNEWGEGQSDGNAGDNLNTAWDLAVLVGTVFTPPPVAVINHPSAAANETYIPIQVNGSDFYARFDPGNSYELNPNATIVSVTWNFGDGSAVVSYTLPIQGGPGGTVPPNTALYSTGDVVTHHFTMAGDYTVSLTVQDDKGQTGSTSVLVHVTAAAVSPIGALTVQSQNTGQATDASGNVQVGIIDQGPNIGQVTIQFDGSSSYDTSSAVQAPKNTRGISAFLWDWPVAPSSNISTPPLGDILPSVNPGGAGDGTFSEGAPDTTLNSGSKMGVQTYAFNFGTDPTMWPGSIIVKLQVTSNFLTGALSTTVSKQVILKPNGSLPTITPVIKNLSVHNITDTTAVVSFDTVDQFGNPVATNATVNYGTTNSYGSNKTDGSLGIHHDVLVSGLSPSTLYHYDEVVTTSGGGSNTPSDNTFTTLVAGSPNLSYSVQSHSLSGNIETVTFVVTNSGSGDALNCLANSFTATSGVTVNGAPLSFGGTGTTILKGGGTITFTVNYTLPGGFNKKSFSAGFKTKYNNSAGTTITGNVTQVVPVP